MQQKSSFIKKNGFTLVETIVVIGILVIIGGIVSGIIYTTLRSANKSRIVDTVSQNGNYALSNITDILNSSLLIQSIGIITISGTCDGIFGESIKLKRIDGGITTLSCSADSIASNSANLTDTDQVKIDSTFPCRFTCTQADIFSSPIIQIEFSLVEKLPTTLFEQKSSATFKTSATLRNYRSR